MSQDQNYVDETDPADESPDPDAGGGIIDSLRELTLPSPTESDLFTKTVEAVRAFFTSEDELPAVNVDYILSRRFDPEHLTVLPEEEAVQCDVCAKLFPITETPEAFEHVASHHGQGTAVLNPFAAREVEPSHRKSPETASVPSEGEAPVLEWGDDL